MFVLLVIVFFVGLCVATGHIIYDNSRAKGKSLPICQSLTKKTLKNLHICFFCSTFAAKMRVSSVRIYAITLIVCCLSALVSPVSAQEEKSARRLIWTKNANRSTGLYTTRNYFVAPGVTVSGFANYYYGDVDAVGGPFSGGFNVRNLKGGGYLAYQHPLSNHCNLRVGLLGGMLSGDNTYTLNALRPDSTKRDDYKKFQSVVVQPFVGVQYYPFSQVGFYLYGGVGLAASIITGFDFIRYDTHEHLKGSTFGILPMAQLGLGYSWMLSTSWSIGVEVMVQQGLCDEYYFNLDAFPLAATQSSDGQAYGTGGTWYKGLDGKRHTKATDGWIQAGITITYQWRNCESCHIINNYHNIRPRKRR